MNTYGEPYPTISSKNRQALSNSSMFYVLSTRYCEIICNFTKYHSKFC